MHVHSPAKTTSLLEKLKWQDGSCTDAPKSMPRAEVFPAFFTHAFHYIKIAKHSYAVA
jgi:hypothetical protein